MLLSQTLLSRTLLENTTTRGPIRVMVTRGEAGEIYALTRESEKRGEHEPLPSPDHAPTGAILPRRDTKLDAEVVFFRVVFDAKFAQALSPTAVAGSSGARAAERARPDYATIQLELHRRA